MNWKIIILGGLAMYIAQWIVGAATGPLIHQGVLEAAYDQTASFWRPELNEDPPNMAALLPRWISIGLFCAFVMAGIYGYLRGAFSGSGVVKGLKYGVVLFLITACYALGWSGVFNLPMTIWGWWMFEGLLYFLAGGAALGFVAQKLVPE